MSASHPRTLGRRYHRTPLVMTSSSGARRAHVVDGVFFGVTGASPVIQDRHVLTVGPHNSDFREVELLEPGKRRMPLIEQVPGKFTLVVRAHFCREGSSIDGLNNPQIRGVIPHGN